MSIRRRTPRALAVVLALATVMGLGACAPRATEWTDQDYVVAGGGVNGVYYAYGGRLAEELSAGLGIEAVVAETAGSVDNLLRVGRGEALLGFAQGDAAANAVVGTGAFDEPLPVQAVARLYDEYVHVVVRDDSDAVDIADLAGQTVSLGAENSGVAVIAGRVLDAAGLGIDAVTDPQLDLGDSIDALERGEIDGFFWVGGLPTPGIQQLADRMDVRLLPVEQGSVNTINDRHSDAYRSADFPMGVYGLTKPTATMAVPNYLITSAAAPDEMIHDVLEILFEGRSRMVADVPTAALLNRRQAIFTAPVELHPGAVDYYREAGR